MYTIYIIRFLLLLCVLYAQFVCAVDTKQPDVSLPFAFNVKLDTSTPITFKPDFSSVGADLGIGVGQVFSLGARSFADTMSGQEYCNDLSRGMGGFADNMGNAFETFNEKADGKLYPEMSKTFRGFLGTAINPRNAWQFGGTVALSIAVAVTGYYFTKFLWELITYKVFNPKPVIVLPGTTYGWWDRTQRWWNGYKTPVMICDESVEVRLTDIEEKTKKIRAHNRTRKNKKKQLTYDNLLLCGEPGTGKTLFARVLADLTDMDIIITTAASLLQSGVQGIKYFNDMMRMAQKSKYGLILFIDEADALFVDRDTLSPDSDHYKVLSHILAMTGQGSNKFMLIAATNHAKVMDSAMGRRFQDRVDMPLPGFATRIALITAYVKQELDKHLQAIFSAEKINEIANRVEGLSHAEIADMIRSIGKSAYASASTNYIDDAVENALNKRRKTEEEKIMREQALNAWRKHVGQLFATAA